MISIALFNNKGGVGKTTLTYHLAHMLQRMGRRLLAVDLDPQSNLTSAFLDEDDLAIIWKEPETPAWGGAHQLSLGSPRVDGHIGTVAASVLPIMEGIGDVQFFDPVEIVDGLWLIPGDLELSAFEDRLSAAWPRCYTGEAAALRTTTAFHRIIVDAAARVDADIVLIDVGPNLGAINRAALLAADNVLMPLAADLFSLRGLRNLGPTLREWRSVWRGTVLPRIPPGIVAPEGTMTPLGYVIMQPTMRLDRPVKAYRRWLDRIPYVFRDAVLGESGRAAEDIRRYEIATLRNYQSLMPLAHDARKPMFDLKAADGALGSTQSYVQKCRAEFTQLAESVLERLSSAQHAPHGTATINIGWRVDTGTELKLDLNTLTRHTVIFGGSGSGKTIFMRRLIEECALQGVSSIVLDPNNDMARLGDPWPEPPIRWDKGDATRAARYFDETEVIVWTPGLNRGRPLSFRPLPDLVAVLDDPDELASALDMAVAALAPRANLGGTSNKAQLGKAVLRQALEYFARQGGRDLTDFISLLSNLPPSLATSIGGADEIAAETGQLLAAAAINDPLFAADSEPLNPGLLLTPSNGKRARVSVISFIGLSEEARIGFVNSLQTALFSWIERNPAHNKSPLGLYFMDEAQMFAPAKPGTEALASTLTLASQARKYGLGLVFATQAPRGLHDHLIGNATTHFIGRINSPLQIEAVRALALARGGSAERVGRLNTGEFYASSVDLSEVLIRTPLCLSYHPSAPLTEAEIIRRARR
ncbi:AAA family ATPase [Nonomuraea sp. NPDC049504]|uniref:AAA family ATPase n=1 Tax=Nonomuraea sp. NPDC049504 TaxID=3154729 RepID=UPI003424ACC4